MIKYRKKYLAYDYPFQLTKISPDIHVYIRIALANFEYSSIRTLISGAHGNQHSPKLTTPTQWKDSALARSQNASASCYMHVHSSLYLPPHNYTPCIKLPFLLKKIKIKNKSMKANFKASSTSIIDQSTHHFKIHYGIYPCRQCRQSIIHEPE